MLQPQFSNQVLSSFLLWMDNKICSKGGFTNYSGVFYPIASPYSNYYAYGAVGNQMVADSSISGANVLTGVYINNTFIGTGVSGFQGIDYKHGFTYFSNNVNNYVISGYFSLKDFNIVLTDKQDDVLLFKTKYTLKPKYPQRPTGILSDNIVYPIIFIKDDGHSMKPYAFGGTEEERINIKCIAIADSLYNLHALQGILQESIRTPIALFSPEDMPFNSMGGLKSGYNYTGMANSRINQQNFMFVENVSTAKFAQKYTNNIDNLNYDCFFNYIDFELSKVRDINRRY